MSNEVLALQPLESRLEAGLVAHTRLPTQQLPRLAVADALVPAEHVHGLPREQRRRGAARSLPQKAVALLEREADAGRQPVGHALAHPAAAEAPGAAAGGLLPPHVPT